MNYFINAKQAQENKSWHYILLTIMKLIISLIILSSALSSYAIPRIIGGSNAPDGKYPYQVSIRYQSKHFCNGVILNKRWILTGAQCLKFRAYDSYEILFGTNLQTAGHGQIYPAYHRVIHEGFDRITLANDLGLIRVDYDIKFDNKVKPIPLSTADDVKVNDPVTFISWSYTNLQYIIFYTMSVNKCQTYPLKFPITNAHICTSSKKVEGVCLLDDGGPLVANGKLIGILTKPIDACPTDEPIVFTKIAYYAEWIKKHITTP